MKIPLCGVLYGRHDAILKPETMLRILLRAALGTHLVRGQA